jgi:DNA (cytosine-5)-methyltransferase 1
VDDVAKCLSAARGAACAHDTSLETYVAQAYGGNNTQGEIDVSTALRAKGGTGHGDFESETFVAQPIPFDTTQITHPEKGGHAPTIAFTCKDYGGDARADGITPTLRAMNETDGNANAGGQIAIAFNARQDPIHTDDLGLPLDTDGTTQAVAFKPSFYTRDHAGGSPEDISQPLLAHDGGPGDTDPVVFEARFARKGRGAPEDVCPPLKAQSGETGKGDAAPLLATAWAVRRLTPTECHRLQGMPDNWCRVEYRGSEMKDGPMYKMLGNAMARNVMEWIGHQIARCVNEDVAL